MQPSKEKRPTLRRLLGFLGPLRAAYLGSMLGTALVRTTERMFIAYVIKLFVDAIVASNIDALWYSVELWFIFLLIWIPVNVLLAYLWRATTLRVITNLRQRIFSHLQRLPLGFHERRHSGDLASVLTNDVSAVEQTFQEDLLTLVNASLQGLLAAVFMAVLNWKLALVVVITGLLPIGINALFAGPLRKVGDAVQQHLAETSERLADLLAGFSVVRTYNLGSWILERFQRANRALLDSSLSRVRLNSNLNAANNFSGMLILVLPLGLGAYMVLTGETTFGTLVAMIQLNGPIQFFVYSLGGTISRIQGSLAAADRILDVLESPIEPEHYEETGGAAGSVPPAGSLLAFEDVHFGYEDEQNVLKGMSFAVRQGQMAAFVGPSGGGKSTIFKLLLGGYPVNRGKIWMSGKSINSFRLSDLRDQFAYIPQDAYLYTGSIQENIAYGKPGATPEEVNAAAIAAYAHEFIMDFPEGYQTKVGERGARLSGGQRQRIAIARALLKDAPVLLLDEATSALDSESEELVQRALGVLMKGRTVLVIAHRLSTIEHADVIYAVEDGKVVEAGTHAELLAQKGLFYRLHELQFREEGEVSAAG